MDKKLQQYAELVIKQGINLEKGEELAVSLPTFCTDLGYHIVEEAYKAGAKKVTMFYNNDKISKLNYIYCDDETLSTVPDWVVQSRDYLMEKKASWLVIISDDPELFSDIDPAKIATASRAMRKALERFRESTSSNKTRWCLAVAPNPVWAQKIFPDLDADAAQDKLWDCIHKACRLDKKDCLGAWKEHEAALARRSKILNEAGIDTLHYKNSLGTDITVGLTKGYHFSGAVEESFYGRSFTANVPTEEVFTSPDKMRADGKVFASMPLIYQGNLIDKFWFEFKDGLIVDFGAEKGYDILKTLLDTDEGSRRLGEVALVGFDSPIQNLKTLFYNTLYDENASCHFAVGRGFPPCIENGLNMTKEQLDKAGINHSLEHVDFMIGTADLEITGTTKDGKKFPVFKKGEWVF